MCYNLKLRNNGPLPGNRLWYSACPKTGSQAIRKVIDDNLSHRLATVDTDWHVTADQIVRFERFHLHKDFIFGTIRNPYKVHVSNYLYQRKNFEEKISYFGREREYQEKHDNLKYMFPDDNWRRAVIYTYEKLLCSFEAYVKAVEQYNTHTLYKRGTRTLKLLPIDKFDTHMSFLFTMDNFYNPRDSRVYLVPIDKPGYVEGFFKDLFDIEIDFELVNSTGGGDTYKDWYTDKLRSVIERIEQPIIYMAGYKY